VQRAVVPIDSLQVRSRSRADSGPLAAAKDVAEERPTSIVLPSQKVETAGDLRSGLASPMMPDGAVQ